MRILGKSAAARIERLLKRFSDPALPELYNLVSGVNDADDVGRIDDGARYSVDTRSKPDFVAKDDNGWLSLDS